MDYLCPMTNFDSEYWDQHYHPNRKPGWDIGYASPALMAFCEKLENKELRILIPGAGHAWEAEHLSRMGFANVFIVEFAPRAIENFLSRFPQFPESKIIREDFFALTGKFDLILEQTFFTSLPRTSRAKYVRQMYNLLRPGGKLVGLLFNHDFDGDHPPFGATREEYMELFMPYFKIKTFEPATNSIKPRQGREFFMILEK
ncbi:MAG: methyltransferase domain-containing protein [Bacteroidales bacterium]|nr:methyltransferase domain-containing protein [Bacteroidales bacterium]MCF8456336.1 methyltransferase domain-containing protein [Bacteroidales bacterium]